jgi:hypothetical protein
MVLGHNVWSGGVVTLVGWVALIKGLVLLFLSPEAAAGLYLGALHYEQLYYLYSAVLLFLGVHLTYCVQPADRRFQPFVFGSAQASDRGGVGSPNASRGAPAPAGART